MKKLLSFLLVIAMLFALSACNKSENSSNDNNTGNNTEINSIYVGEWKANTIKSRLDNVITYQVTSMVLREDGTCNFNELSAKWEYIADQNQITLTFDRNNLSDVLEISKENGKTVINYSYATFYKAEDFIAKDKEYVNSTSANPDDTHFLPNQPNTKEINITLDNWNEYFEIKEIPLWKENAFGEIDDLALWWGIYLKEEYHNKVDLTQMGSVAFALNGKYQCAGILIDYKNQKYNYIDGVILDDIEEVSTTDVFDFASLLDPSASKFGFCRIWSSGLFEYELNGANTTFTYKHFDISVSRVEGNIYLFD